MTWIGLIISLIFSFFSALVITVIIIPAYEYNRDTSVKIFFWGLASVLFAVLLLVCFWASADLQKDQSFNRACEKLAQADTELPASLTVEEKTELLKRYYDRKPRTSYSSGSSLATGYLIGKCARR